MSDHIPVSDEKRELEKAQPSQLPLMENSSKPVRTRDDVLAHLAAAKRAESLTSGSSADDADERDSARSAVDSEQAKEPARVWDGHDQDPPASRSGAMSCHQRTG